jgi:hypothetical protein
MKWLVEEMALLEAKGFTQDDFKEEGVCWALNSKPCKTSQSRF